MNPQPISNRDRVLARFCERCPACTRARKKQSGLAFWLVKTVEGRICPFCRAYARVHGRMPHEPPTPNTQPQP